MRFGTVDSISSIGAGTWPLVGRVEELDLLLDTFDRADRHGAVLAGPPGVGKSRLAREAVEAAARAGWRTEYILATEGLDRIPFGAVSHLLSSDLEPDAGHFGIFRGVMEELDRRAPDGRLALMIDDAHVLDDQSAGLVHQLVRSGKVRVVATLRASVPAPTAVTALWKDGLALRVDLAELSPVDCDDLLKAVLGGAVEGPTRRRIWSLTRGNALFLREFVLTALEDGALEEREGLWRLGSEVSLGGRFAELVAQRLGRLDDEQREVLEVLAVADPLALRTLRAVVGDDATVADLERLGFVIAYEDHRRMMVRAGHPVYRETLRSAMPQTRRMELERRLADVVEGWGARRRGDVLRVANWRLSAEQDPDPRLSLEGAATALARFDDALALRLGQASLDAGGGIEAALVCARSLGNLHRAAEAERILARFEDEVRSAPHDVRRQYLERRVQTVLFGVGDVNAAATLLERLADMSSGPAWDGLLDACRLRVGMASQTSTALVDRVETVGRDAAIERDVRLSALEAAAAVRWYAGASATALELFDLAIELAGDDVARVFSLEYERLGPYHHTGPRPTDDRMLAFYEQALEAGWHHGTALWAHAIGVSHLLAGRADQGCAWLREAAATMERSDPAGFLPLCIAQLAAGEAMRADVAASRRLQEEARRRSGEDVHFLGTTLSLAEVHVALAERRLSDAVRFALDRAQACRGRIFTEASALHSALRFGAPPAPVAERLGEIAGDVESDLLKTFARQAQAVHEQDGTTLEELCGIYESIGNALWGAEAAAQASRAYTAEGRQDSARRAASRSRKLREGVEGVWTPAMELDEGPVSLRPREREVAELAARGMTNGEIGEVLGISPRTVETHLQRAYLKLGVNRREDLGSVL